MKYRIKTIEENGKFVGYVLNNDEVIFTSTPQETPTLASIQVTKFINQQANQPLVATQPVLNSNMNSIPASVIPSTSPSVPEPPPRRCCGRG